MEWAFEAVTRYLLLPAVLALAITVLHLWKASDPSGQKKLIGTVQEHEAVILGLNMKSNQFESFMKETRGHGERLKVLEVEVGHVKEDTGEIKTNVQKMTEAFNEFLRENGGH
jgi:hypothetical protein